MKMKALMIAALLACSFAPTAFAEDKAQEFSVALRGCKEPGVRRVEEKEDGMKWSADRGYSISGYNCQRVEISPVDGSQASVAVVKMGPKGSLETTR